LFFFGAAAMGSVVAKRLTRGDEDADDVRLVAVVGGRNFASRASALRSVSVLAAVGGVDLDLRETTLHPDGASLDVTAVVGGVDIKLPAGWAVDLDSHSVLGGVDARLTEAADLPEGAPRLHVNVKARLGGVAIRSDRG
jgi:predicted membrane protein